MGAQVQGKADYMTQATSSQEEKPCTEALSPHDSRPEFTSVLLSLNDHQKDEIILHALPNGVRKYNSIKGFSSDLEKGEMIGFLTGTKQLKRHVDHRSLTATLRGRMGGDIGVPGPCDATCTERTMLPNKQGL